MVLYPTLLCTNITGRLKHLSCGLSGRGIIEKSPLQNIKPLITIKKIIRPFSEQDIQKFLALIAGTRFLERRNRAMILLFVDTGLCLNEMVELVMSSIELDCNTL